MPAAIVWAIAAIGVETGSAFLIMYAAEVATGALILGGLAYSSYKARQAKEDARNQYNAAQVDRLATVSSAIAPRDLVLGRVRKAGTVFYRNTTGANSQDLYLAIALAGHELDAIEQIYLNDVPVTLDGSGNVTTAPYSNSTTLTASGTGSLTPPGGLPATYVAGSLTSGTYSYGGDSDQTTTAWSYQYTSTTSTVQITQYLGAAGQAADAALQAAFPADWTSANTVAGVAYLVVKLSYSETAFPSGVPNVSAVVRGAKLYDPRSGTTAWSQNPALMMRHVYAHPRFGKASVSAAEDARFSTAANACDAATIYTVAGVAQASRALYTAALVAPFGTAPKALLDDLAQAMGGSWAFAGGEIFLRPGSYVAPVMSLTDADLAVIQRDGASENQRPISIAVHKERAQKFNTVKASIYDPAQDYKQSSLTPLVGSSLLARDGVELVQQVTMPAINYAPQALHVAGIMMRDARDPLVVELPFKLRAYPLELFDTVSLTLSRYGWSAKTFMILGRQWSADGSIVLTLKETSAAIVTLDAGFSAQGFASNSNLGSPWLVYPPSPITVSSGAAEMFRQADGTIVSRMRVSWPQISNAAVRQAGRIEVQYRNATSTGAWASLLVPGDETQVVTSDVVAGVTYLVRVRARTSLATSDWNLQSIHQVIGNTVAPSAPALSATGAVFNVRLTWSYGDTRQDIAGTEIWFASSNNRSSASRLSFEPFPALEYSHANLSAGQGGYYWARVVDTFGNASAWYPSSATAGLYATASTDPSAVLTQINKSLGFGQLAAELAAPIGSLPGADNAVAVAALQSALSDYDLTNRMVWQENVTNATVSIDPITGKIALLATANVSTDVTQRLTVVEVQANASAATLSSTVATLSAVQGNLTSTQSAVTLLQGQIVNTASTVYVDNSVANASGAITTTSANAYSALAQAEVQAALDVFTGQQSSLTLSANVAAAQSSIKTNADALGALSTSYAALVATYAGNAATTAAAITTEQTTRANADTALASRTTTLESAVNASGTGLASKAAITYVDDATATLNASIASSSSTLTAAYQAADSATLSSAQSYVNTYSYAKATVDSNIASSVGTVSARLDTGDYAAVKTSASASASAITGLQAQYVLKVDANGRVAGMTLASGGTGSSVVFLADKFGFVKADGSGTPKTIMALGTVGGVSTLGLDGNLVLDGSIVAQSIDTRNLTIKDASGNVILSAGNALSGTYIASATVDSIHIKDGAVTLSNYASDNGFTRFFTAGSFSAGSIDDTFSTLSIATLSGDAIIVDAFFYLTTTNVGGATASVYLRPHLQVDGSDVTSGMQKVWSVYQGTEHIGIYMKAQIAGNGSTRTLTLKVRSDWGAFTNSAYSSFAVSNCVLSAFTRRR